MRQISHFVGLSGIGGVQRNFVEYINHQVESELEGEFLHKVYTLGKVDQGYNILAEVYDIRKVKFFLSLVLDMLSRKKIVHFYNNLTSFKMAVPLLLLPVHNIILHERGSAWNLPSYYGILLRFIVWKSSLVLANSNATKIMLEKKFNIPSKKIKVLHNGINKLTKYIKNKKKHNAHTYFHVGFIGRLDTPKGVHVLIDAMNYLVNYNIKLTIAGDGALEDILKDRAKDLENIFFIGRINNPYVFFSSIDLLAVPSIREPLGNVCLESGLCKVPVLAANIDGIPEIVENKITGELIDATDEILISFPENAIPLPEFVVHPITKQLCTPKQINPHLLAKKILELSSNPKQLEYYADGLYKRVTGYFNMNRYKSELHTIYSDLYNL